MIGVECQLPSLPSASNPSLFPEWSMTPFAPSPVSSTVMAVPDSLAEVAVGFTFATSGMP